MTQDPVELRDAAMTGERLGPADFAVNSEVVDVTFEDCDVVGVIAQQSRLERVTVTNGRLRAVSWVGGVIRDVTLDGVIGADVSCRFSSLRKVVIRGSQLPGLDLTEAELDQVTFERCDLRGAKFDHVKVKSLSISGCNLAAVTGAIDLRGASIDLDDVLSLAPSLAREIGITIE